MAKRWEVKGLVSELQMAWLRAHYPEEVLEAALQRLPRTKKGFPLNVAVILVRDFGGQRMPSPEELLASHGKNRPGLTVVRPGSGSGPLQTGL
jgi:hypothetical protein